MHIVTRNGCYSSPCMNGLCIDGVGSFYCNCLPTWTGKLCNGISRKKFKRKIHSFLFLEKISQVRIAHVKKI